MSDNLSGLKKEKTWFWIMAMVLLFPLAACQGGGKEVISGKLRGAEGKTIYLESFANNKSVFTDSTVIGTDGSFVIHPTVPLQKDFYRLFISETDYITLITDSTESPVISGELGKLETTRKINGSPDSELLQELENKLSPFRLEEQEARKRMMTPSASDEERSAGSMKVLEIRKNRTEYIRKWLDTNSSSPAALIAVQYLDPTADIKMVEKVFTDLESYFGHTTVYRGMRQQIKLLQQEMANAKNPAMSAISAGQIAPEIAQEDPSGKIRKLSDLRGKTVLLDFWASWCGPCRRENPNVVAAYKKYNKDGFEVFSVSLDKAKQSWTDAITKDGLIWPNHVSDLQWWQSETAQTYGVQSIPFTVLIDKEGKILAHNIRGAQLQQRLAEIYGH